MVFCSLTISTLPIGAQERKTKMLKLEIQQHTLGKKMEFEGGSMDFKYPHNPHPHDQGPASLAHRCPSSNTGECQLPARKNTMNFLPWVSLDTGLA